jgi:hypothetical protein
MLACDSLSFAKLLTLGRIFSCFHDRDHVHPDIQANSYTGSYAKHAIHPPKINTPNFQGDFSSCILAKGERVHWKSICSKSIGKNVLQSKSIEKKRKKVKHDPLQNKCNERISKQWVLHYVKTSKRSHNICNGSLTSVTSTHICNGCCLAPVTYKRARTTPGLASTTPVTNVDFW